MQSLPRLALYALFAMSAAHVAAASPASGTDWPVADAGARGWNTERLAALDAAIKSGEAPDTTSVLVIHRGALIHEVYFNGADRDTLHTRAR